MGAPLHVIVPFNTGDSSTQAVWVQHFRSPRPGNRLVKIGAESAHDPPSTPRPRSTKEIKRRRMPMNVPAGARHDSAQTHPQTPLTTSPPPFFPPIPLKKPRQTGQKSIDNYLYICILHQNPAQAPSSQRPLRHHDTGKTDPPLTNSA
jgi:hypothetical protein